MMYRLGYLHFFILYNITTASCYLILSLRWCGNIQRTQLEYDNFIIIIIHKRSYLQFMT